jgi:hypothetical protein
LLPLQDQELRPGWLELSGRGGQTGLSPICPHVLGRTAGQRRSGLGARDTSHQPGAVGCRLSHCGRAGAAWRPRLLAGSDGTPQAPGHVGIVIGDGEIINAYAAGFPVRVATYGQPLSPAGDQVVVGFSRPVQVGGCAVSVEPASYRWGFPGTSRGGGSVEVCGSADRLCAGRRAGLGGSAICSWRLM